MIMRGQGVPGELVKRDEKRKETRPEGNASAGQRVPGTTEGSGARDRRDDARSTGSDGGTAEATGSPFGKLLSTAASPDTKLGRPGCEAERARELSGVGNGSRAEEDRFQKSGDFNICEIEWE